jgi:uncharacterized protein (DUF4415 family)
MDDETIELMLERNVYYVPTLVCNSDEQVMLDNGGLDKFQRSGPGYQERKGNPGIRPDT